MSFSILLVDYKTIDDTIRYIDYCRSNLISSGKTEYIIVDNSEGGNGRISLERRYGSAFEINAGDRKVIQFGKDGERCFYYALYSNVGYARGNNVAAEISAVLFPENNLCISNNDIVFANTCNLDQVENLLDEDDVFCVGPDVVQGSTHLNPLYKQGRLYNLYGNMLSLGTKNNKPDDYTFSGCFWFFNKEKFCQIKGFDEGTFIYFEEYIISEKAKDHNWRMVYLPDLEVIHDHREAGETVEKAIWKRRQFLKSLMYYERKYHGLPKWKESFSSSIYEIALCLFGILLRIRKH